MIQKNKERLKIVKKLSLGILAVLFSFNAFAVDVSVDVTSDTLEVERVKGLATFKGSVKALYRDVTLTSDILKIYYDEKSKAENKIEKIIAIGHVVLIQGSDRVTSDYAEYFLDSENVIFKENVILNRNGNILKGDHLTMNTVTNKAKMRSKGKNRVKAVYFKKSENKGN